MSDPFGSLLPLDTRVIKRLAPIGRLEAQFRYPFLGISALALWHVYGLWELLIWYVVRIAFHFVFVRTIARIPDRMGLWGTMGLAMMVLLDGFIYTALAIYLWWLHEPVFLVLAMAVLATGMLTVSWIRSDAAFLWICDSVTLAITLVAIPVVHVMRGGSATETVLLSGLFVLVFVYFVMSIWSVWRARADNWRAQEVEIQRAKSDAFGKIAGGMAHDFNNLLTVVLGSIELSRLAQQPGERAQLIEEAEEAAKRGAEMIGQLLAFSRKARLETRQTTVAEILAGVSPLIGSVLGARHWLNQAPLPDLPGLDVDMGKVQSVLLELVLNARDAMPAGGEIFFEAWASTALGQPTVSMAIADNGAGIPKDMKLQVFEPFFSTRAQSTGLGLSMVKGIVEQSGGRVDLLSAPGLGTRMVLHFPAATDI